MKYSCKECGADLGEIEAFTLGHRLGYCLGLQKAAQIAFDKIRCDDRTDRLQIAEDVQAAILERMEGSA